MPGRRAVAMLVALLSLLLASCRGEPATTSPAGECADLQIVVTTSILGDVVSNLVGDRGVVEVLMPVGADPHSFQVSARQAAAMREADLVVVNGLGLEEGMLGAIEGAAADGAVVVEAASLVDPLPFAGRAEEDDDDHGTLDPHIWTDPRRMADVAAGLGEALAAADPGCPQRWRDGAEAYRRDLLALDEQIETILAVVPTDRRKLVTNHHSLGYFADRYGFVILGAVIPGGGTLAEPSPADLAALAETLAQEGVRAVFAETTHPTDLSEALAAELGEEVAVVRLFTGSLGEPGSGAETYLGMQRTNAERIAGALGGPS